MLADGWSYAGWVVGAARVRAVGDDWPGEGASIHHSVGTSPLVIDDSTSVVAASPPHHIRLRARGWPIGEAEVDITVDDVPGGCLLTIRETSARGPATLLLKPVEDAALHVRNAETLRRLAHLAERRSTPVGD